MLSSVSRLQDLLTAVLAARLLPVRLAGCWQSQLNVNVVLTLLLQADTI